MAGFGDPTPDLDDLNTRRSGTFPAAGRNFPRFRARGNIKNLFREHDQDVIQMNEVYHCASAWVQRAARNVASMITSPAIPTGDLAIPAE